jgi:hypothetical protein
MFVVLGDMIVTCEGGMKRRPGVMSPGRGMEMSVREKSIACARCAVDGPPTPYVRHVSNRYMAAYFRL